LSICSSSPTTSPSAAAATGTNPQPSQIRHRRVMWKF
jgi:hypothetical protein